MADTPSEAVVHSVTGSRRGALLHQALAFEAAQMGRLVMRVGELQHSNRPLTPTQLDILADLVDAIQRAQGAVIQLDRHVVG